VRLPHLALVGALGLGLVACSSDEPAGRDDSEAQSSIIQPGRPGEDNETLDPDAVVEPPGTNETDIAFMQMMVPHHAQALEMSELARSRADDEQVSAIARRIKGAQGPEIMGMASWLESRGLEVPETTGDAEGGPDDDHSGHGDHGDHAAGVMAMQGMLSAREMAELADAQGATFDRLFLAGMIRHHQGAVAMAREEMEAGSDTVAVELAADVAAGQQAEIRRMVDIRARL
jgi:uncharacterized protein (DUF305 family)